MLSKAMVDESAVVINCALAREGLTEGKVKKVKVIDKIVGVNREIFIWIFSRLLSEQNFPN